MEGIINMLVNDTSKIECLLQSLQEYIDAKNDLAKAQGDFDGHSFEYWGWREIKRVEDCAKDFQDRLNEIITAKVEELVKSHLERNIP